MNQQLTQTDIASVPSTTIDKDKIKGSIKEISDCLTRKQAETDLINDIAEGLKDEFGLSKRLVNSLAKTYLEGNFESQLNELNERIEEYEEFFTSVMK